MPDIEPTPTHRPIKDALIEAAHVLRLVRDYGQEFPHVVVPPWVGGVESLPSIGDCYRTAFWMMGTVLTRPYRTPPLIYTEGVALHPNARGQVVEHAWLVTTTGSVIDPTWAKRAAECEYYGVPLKEDFVRRIAAQARQFGVLHLLDETTVREAVQLVEVV